MIEKLKCLNPMHLLIIPNGRYSKKQQKFVNNIKFVQTGSENEVRYYPDIITGEIPRLVTLDCGKCFACRRKKAFNHSFRLMMEAKYYQDHYGTETVNFITFTYDELLLPSIDLAPDVICNVTENEKEKERFIRALKRKLKYNGYTDEQIRNIKYYWINEYGEKNLRPHYHCMLFGVNLFQPFEKKNPKFDMYNMEYNENNNPQYFSRMLDSIWAKGRVTFAPFTASLANYICKYITKTEDAFQRLKNRYYGILANKGYLQKDINNMLDLIDKPHSFKSNNLGKRYLLEHKDEIVKNGKIYLYGSKYNLIGYVFEVLKNEISPMQKLQLNALYELMEKAEMEQHSIKHEGLLYHQYMRDAIITAENEYKKRLRRQLL